jgi:uroporphyrinogen decarboxylase
MSSARDGNRPEGASVLARAQAAVLGFVGSPWTLATYIIEGKSSALYKTIKTMLYQAPQLLQALLGHLADQIAAYSCFQIDSGAQCVQLFDSWGGQLPPQVHPWTPLVSCCPAC